MKVLALAGDAGGARALSPVLKRLTSQPGITLQVQAYAAAVEIWRREGWPVAPVDVSAVASCDRLLLGTSWQPEQWELEAIAAARQAGIRSVSVLDSWVNYRVRFHNRWGEFVLPDAIAVMDESARTEMVGEGFPTEQLAVTGHPGFDELERFHSSEAQAAARKKVTQALGLDGSQTAQGAVLPHPSPLPLGEGTATHVRRGTTRAGSAPTLDTILPLPAGEGRGEGERPPNAEGANLHPLLLLFASQPISQMADGASWGFDEHLVLSDIIAALDATLRGQGQQAVLLVKRHPREMSELTLPKTAALSTHVVDDSLGDYRELVAASDFVLGMNSNLLLEACLLGKPVVSYQPGLLRPDPLPSNRLGWSRAVTTRDALAPAVAEEIFDDSRRRSRKELLRSLPRPSGAAERVMRLLLDSHGCNS
ncbi:MAG: hypothetical protein FD161_1031 [Limisphaerales bacterium]|nr:MAG: hypothetical protein FD161_1031 [Limisphaerales bacterium]KAG0509814.1 MAG: hypothetical protein E1N63_1031 [Limisphaerales bacterium]TXT50964.1 MAG: hypothetical protein FD140_2026 [Limisphaerales bacterium]